MAYICKNCGKIVSEVEFNEAQRIQDDAIGCGCFIWLIIILCFVSVILIPIAIILILGMHKDIPENECPYCKAKNSLIPDNTPIAKKMIKDNYTEEEQTQIQQRNEWDAIKVKNQKSNFQIGCQITLWIIVAYIILAIIASVVIK